MAVVAAAGWTVLAPAHGSWAFAAAELAFLLWLSREIRRADGAALAARSPTPLDADELDVVRRYAWYFARPALARECASILAALGLASLGVVPWLTYKVQLPQALLVGVMLFAVGRLTRLASPTYALRLAIAKGDREALRLLSAHDGAARKLSGEQQPGP